MHLSLLGVDDSRRSRQRIKLIDVCRAVAYSRIIVDTIVDILWSDTNICAHGSATRCVMPCSYDLAHVELLTPRPEASLDFFV